ncbi:hypothetical protein F5Y06DRAFT_119393 [Hypoxylon sp. FL0890]|nr:hypothetical protein F5Y06DRAFT_119393 [Hypoxylon sp. FL0890]
MEFLFAVIMAVDDNLGREATQEVLALQVQLNLILELPPHNRLAAIGVRSHKTKEPAWQVLAANTDVFEQNTPEPASVKRRTRQSLAEKIEQEKAKREKARAKLLKARVELVTMLGENRVKQKKLTSPAPYSCQIDEGRAAVQEIQQFRRFFAMKSRQLSPSYEEAVSIRSRPVGEWDLWCYSDKGFLFCKRREAMIKNWQRYFDYITTEYAHFRDTSLWSYLDEAGEHDKKDTEDAEDANDHVGRFGQDDINSCTEMVQQQLIDQGRFREAERLEVQKHDLDVRDYICLLNTLVVDRTNEMINCIQKAVSNTVKIRQELRERHWKHQSRKRRRGIDSDQYRGLADGRPSPLRTVTNIEDVEDEPTGTKISEKPWDGTWGDEEEEPPAEFKVTWAEDDAGLEWR